MKKLLTLFSCVLFILPALQAQTTLYGTVTDKESGEPIPLATVKVLKGGQLITGQNTDFDGNYNIPALDAGTYDVEVSSAEFTPQLQTGVRILGGKSNKLDFLITKGKMLDAVDIVEYTVPLIQTDNTAQGKTLTSDDIKNLPTKNINTVAATTAGVSSEDGGALNIRGSRSGNTKQYIDGIPTTVLPPSTELEQLEVVTGGIGAEYGDVTGGIVSGTTKGPARRFSGDAEFETNSITSKYGYNSARASFSGPILKNKNKESILGFRLSGEYRTFIDDDPQAYGAYYVKESVVKNLQDNPVTYLGSTALASSEFLTDKDVELLKARKNEDRQEATLIGKLDFKINKAIDLTFSGFYEDVKNRFTPDYNTHSTTDTRWGTDWSLLNSDFNPREFNKDYTFNVRLRHRFGNTSSGEEGSNAVVQNAYYTLNGGFQHGTDLRYDPRHTDNWFEYGHVGSLDVKWIPSFAYIFNQGTVTAMHTGYTETLVGYDFNNTSNQGLANYNKGIENIKEISSRNDLLAYNSYLQPSLSRSWSFFDNVHAIYDNYRKAESNQTDAYLTIGFDLVPGSSKTGRHSIQLGLGYEQNDNRVWSFGPYQLWAGARLLANNHILGINKDIVVGKFNVADPLNPGDSLMVDEYAILTQNDSILKEGNFLFYKSVREKFNLPLDSYINVDKLNPSDLSLDMFTATEINEFGLQGYYGYDYLGNKLSSKVKFEDFFKHRDSRGYLDFPVASYQPLYMSGYLQDKFLFKDIIFKVGVRADYFDANTKVMRDPYCLYQIKSASQFYNDISKPVPSGIDNSWNVYVEDKNPNKVVAYRAGDVWYNTSGAVVDPKTIFGDGSANPALVKKVVGGKTISPAINDFKNYDPATSFKDYEAKLNIMPRLAFSFPISDDANFFAHYDVLVQRPTVGNIVTPLNYFYMFYPNRATLNNAALKPERTIDYEVGFKQKLTNTSAISLSAYYKEMRDMIQRRVYKYTYILNNFTQYDNLDFGTAKGFSVSYDMRRTGNIYFQAAYTLQFADGTGSDENSQSGIVNVGNVRNLFPLNFDERHRISTTIDYRYGNGKKYNGPRISGMDILSDFGVNLLVTAVSGRPYTRNLSADKFGGKGILGAINGARKPWNLTLDLRVDKSFKLKVSKAESATPLDFNIYARISNLLDARNIIGVYPVTGSPEDSGYLVTADGEAAQKDAFDSHGGTAGLNSYLDTYNFALLDPDHYIRPRRIILGATVTF